MESDKDGARIRYYDPSYENLENLTQKYLSASVYLNESFARQDWNLDDEFNLVNADPGVSILQGSVLNLEDKKLAQIFQNLLPGQIFKCLFYSLLIEDGYFFG